MTRPPKPQHVTNGVRRCLLVNGEATTAQLADWAYVRKRRPPLSRMWWLRRIADQHAHRVGRMFPGGIVWRRKEPP